MNATTIAFFESIRSRSAAKTLQWQEFLALFSKEAKHLVLADKKDAPVFAAATFGPEATRKRDNITSVTAIVLDTENPMMLVEVNVLCNTLGQLGVSFVAHTTFSSEPDALKIRLIVPLATPVSVKTFEKERFAARLAQLLNVEIDPICKRAAEVYFVPSCPPGLESIHFSFAHEGRPLEESDLPVQQGISQVQVQQFQNHASLQEPLVYEHPSNSALCDASQVFARNFAD